MVEEPMSESKTIVHYCKYIESHNTTDAKKYIEYNRNNMSLRVYDILTQQVLPISNNL